MKHLATAGIILHTGCPSLNDLLQSALCPAPRTNYLHTSCPEHTCCPEHVRAVQGAKPTKQAPFLDEQSPGSVPGYNITESQSCKTTTTTARPCLLSINIPCDHISANRTSSMHISPGLRVGCYYRRVQAGRVSSDGAETGFGGGTHI